MRKFNRACSKVDFDKRPEPKDFSLSPDDIERIERETLHASCANSPFNFLSYGWYPWIPFPLLGKEAGIPFAIILGIFWLIYIFRFQDKLNYSYREKLRRKVAGLQDLDDYKSALYKFDKLQNRLKLEKEKNEREERRKNYEYWSTLDPYEFEKEVGLLFEKHGFSSKVTKGSGDGGIDILLVRDKKHYVVQCKRYATKVGPAPVRDLYGTMISENHFGAFLVCPSGFSEKAFEFAKGKNIQFIGLKRIMEMVLSNEKSNLNFLNSTMRGKNK